MPCSRPSCSRRRSRPTGSASWRAATRTCPSSSATSKPMASSAHGSSVQPLARSKRAWCQWQVTSPASTVPWWRGKPRCGHRSSMAYGLPSCHTTSTGSEPTLVSRRPSRTRSSTDPAGTVCSNVMIRACAGRQHFVKLRLGYSPARGRRRQLAGSDVGVQPVVHGLLLSPHLDHPGLGLGRVHPARHRERPHGHQALAAQERDAGMVLGVAAGAVFSSSKAAISCPAFVRPRRRRRRWPPRRRRRPARPGTG